MLPFLLMVPFLFIAGVVFAYFVVVPAAVKFLLNFNEDEFNIQVRASEYYGFFIITLIAIGLVFQVPIGDPRGDPARHRHARSSSSKNRRYAIW